VLEILYVVNEEGGTYAIMFISQTGCCVTFNSGVYSEKKLHVVLYPHAILFFMKINKISLKKRLVCSNLNLVGRDE
jgi:hypothetical protein